MKKLQWLRYFLLAFFIALLTWFGYQHQVLGGGIAPPIDAYCPFGGVENLYGFLSEGTWLRRTAPSSLILFIGVFLVTLVLGRFFCGWICPLGGITEFTRKIAKKMGIKKIIVPQILDKFLRSIKYIILFVVLYFTAKLGVMVIRDYDPWVAFTHLTGGFDELALGFYVLLFILLLEVFVERAWCKYACPLGAVFGITNFLTLFKIRRKKESCIQCQKCNKVCSVGIPLATSLKANTGCISCMACVEVCPKENTLNYSMKNGFTLTPLVAVFFAFLLFFGVYGIAKVSGVWATRVSNASMTLIRDSDRVFDWMTLEEVAKEYNYDVTLLKEKLNIKSSVLNTVPLKNLENFNTENMKLRLDAVIREEKRLATNSSIEKTPIVSSVSTFSAPDHTELEGKKALGGGSDPNTMATPADIKGSMTIAGIAQRFQLETKDILQEAGLPENTLTNVRLNILSSEHGVEIEVIREAVWTLIKKS